VAAGMGQVRPLLEVSGGMTWKISPLEFSPRVEDYRASVESEGTGHATQWQLGLLLDVEDSTLTVGMRVGVRLRSRAFQHDLIRKQYEASPSSFYRREDECVGTMYYKESGFGIPFTIWYRPRPRFALHVGGEIQIGWWTSVRESGSCTRTTTHWSPSPTTPATASISQFAYSESYRLPQSPVAFGLFSIGTRWQVIRRVSIGPDFGLSFGSGMLFAPFGSASVTWNLWPIGRS